ncbi:MAG: hypothetical protein R3181_00410 [Rubricoccaceae bacterium]|nr:hypothetical protein [Rubricoccaceae bacterium]
MLCKLQRRLLDAGGRLRAASLTARERYHAARLASLGYLRRVSQNGTEWVVLDETCHPNPVPWPDVRDERMLEMLVFGDALDVSACVRSGEGDYLLGVIPDADVLRYATGFEVARLAEEFTVFDAEVELCDAEVEQWIGSVGVHRENGHVWASLDPTFYRNYAFVCIYLR